ncbi:MAG: SDR family oxidoreductase [Flavobacteriaceae bacterium]|nr:SDR family oxidoreductase [Flavobacteriaceae bacterium]PHX77443.1 MAG: oxidoreductase [Flavobacteriales bacterium]
MNYIVFGGSRGIGSVVVDGLVSQGHSVWSVSRSGKAAAGAVGIAWDAVSDEVPPGLPSEIHGVVYAPGSINLKPFRGLKLDEFRADFELNAMGAVKALQACLPGMKLAGKASVVLFSTVAVQTGMSFHASIAMAKGAIEGLTRSLAAEWAPQIRVNAVAPSLVNTDLASRLLSTPEKVEASGKRHPLQRIGEPNDIASVVLFLLGDGSDWITGQVMAVDGGMGSLRT